jgi:MoaA/NifB/PqqE/SkfB family radical SAM enzyme
MPNTGILTNGGLMVNYQCNAACRHCLYSCSPTRGSGYINEETAGTICRLLRKGGCRSVHIGGGEPFLDFDGLLMVVRKLKNSGIALEYIETNAHWLIDASTSKEGIGREKLKRLLAAGADTLCISIDPYHAEYVPYGAPLALAKLCEEAGKWFLQFLH